MDLSPLVYIVKAIERHFLLLIRGLLLVVSTVSTILAISLGRVDFLVTLLLLCEPLTMRLKKSSLCFRSLDACVRDCKQIGHCLGLLHGDLLNSIDVTDSVAEGVDDLDVLDISDIIPGIAEIFYVVSKALIMLLPDGLESLSSRWTFICVLKVSDEHGT
jgi:hypothetical protein